jgi:glutathione S-transferase
MHDQLTIYGSFTSEAAYLAVNRYGQVPALRHRGLTIVQSNVILAYLAETTGHFEGATEQDRWTAREWLSWEADNVTNIAKVRHYSRFRAVDPAVMAYFRPLAEAALGFVDKALEGRQWLVGDQCSIADIGCWGRMVFMAEGGLEITRWPNVEAWSKRIKALPRFALPYDLIPKKDTEFLGA